MFLVKSIECHNLQHSLQLQVAFWKKQLHRSGAIQVDSCLSSKHRKKTKQRAGRLGRGRHSDWCRHQNSGHEVVSLLLDDAVSKNLWRMLSMAPKIQLLYGFVRSKRLQCSTSTTRDAFQIEESSPVPAAPTNQRNKWRSTSDRDVRHDAEWVEWPRFYQGGRKPRKVRGQLERREEQVLHSHTEKTPSLMVKYSEHGTRLRSRCRVTLRYRPEKIGTRKLQKSPCKYNRSWLMLTCHGFRLTSSIN